MLLTIDVGNSRIKAAVFEEDTLIDLFIFEHHEVLKKISKIIEKYPKHTHAIYSSVGKLSNDAIEFINKNFKTTTINSRCKFPFTNKYSTPKTLGIDRMVLASGATLIFPNKNRLIIDAGTCITYDFVDKNNCYYGGTISPGIKLRYNSLHNYTAKLPLLTIMEPENFIGDSTNNSIHSGVINGLCYEIEGFISQYYLKYQDLTVILTGGDTEFLAKRLKSTIFANPNFLLESLNKLSIYTENND